MRRGTSDRKELARIAEAIERAEADLAEREHAIAAARQARAEVQSAAAASYLDEPGDYDRARQNAEHSLSEATLARDRATDAVEGLRLRAAELAGEIAARAVGAASKAHNEAVAALAEAEQLVAERHEGVASAKLRLEEAEQVAVAPSILWEVKAQVEAGRRRRERVRWLARQPTYVVDNEPAEIREAVEAERERLRREAEASRRHYIENLPDGHRYLGPAEPRRVERAAL